MMTPPTPHSAHTACPTRSPPRLLSLHLLPLCLLPAFLPPLPADAQPSSPRIIEWQLPRPMYARSSAIAPDGSLFIAVPNDNKILRFDPRSTAFSEWELPPGHHPNSIVVDRKGTVWTAGFGNGTIGRLKPSQGAIAEFYTPSRSGGPHTLALSEDETTLWFSLQSGNRIGGMDTATGRIAEYETTGGPTGIAIDRNGQVWWCRPEDGKLGRLDPQTGRIGEVDLGRGSRPRRIATAPDGTLWVTLYGKGQLAKVNPVTGNVVKTYPLPGGNAGAHAVAVDAAGIVWVSEIRRDTVMRFDPAAETLQTIPLPSPNAGIRKLTVEPGSRIWYTGSHNGKLGVIE